MAQTERSSDMDFDALLLEAVDEALGDLLGETLREPFYRYFEEKFCTSKSMIPKHLENFVVVLSKIFGVLGVLVIGRAIAKRLYSKLDLEFVQKSEATLLDYVREAHARVAEMKTNEISKRLYEVRPPISR